MSNDQYLVLSVRSERKTNYISRTESTEDHLIYVSLNSNRSPTSRGLELLYSDLSDTSFGVSDFVFPSICRLITRPIPGKGKKHSKLINRIKDVEFIRDINFPESGYLVLGAFTWSIEQTSGGSSLRGIKLSVVDLEQRDVGDFSGYMILDPSHINGSFRQYSSLPGIYDMTFDTFRGKDNQSFARVESSRLVNSFDVLNNSIREVDLLV